MFLVGDIPSVVLDSWLRATLLMRGVSRFAGLRVIFEGTLNTFEADELGWLSNFGPQLMLDILIDPRLDLGHLCF